MRSSALGDSKDFHVLGADSKRERSSALSVCRRVFLLRNLNTWVEGKTLNTTQTQPNANMNRKDTVVDSDAQHPAATPAFQRVKGRWPSARSQWADPDCPCSARKAGRLQRPGYWWNLWQTVEKTWGKEGGMDNIEALCQDPNRVFNSIILADIVLTWRIFLNECVSNQIITKPWHKVVLAALRRIFNTHVHCTCTWRGTNR